MQMLGKQMHYSDYRLLKLRIIYLLYNIGVLNTPRFGAFVLKNGDFCGMNGAYSMQKYLYYNHFCIGVFF